MAKTGKLVAFISGIKIDIRVRSRQVSFLPNHQLSTPPSGPIFHSPFHPPLSSNSIKTSVHADIQNVLIRRNQLPLCPQETPFQTSSPRPHQRSHPSSQSLWRLASNLHRRRSHPNSNRYMSILSSKPKSSETSRYWILGSTKSNDNG